MASSSGNEKKITALPGYKFFPSDEILVDYLEWKNFDKRNLSGLIPTIHDLYNLNPNQIPLDKFEDGVEGEWIFFTKRPNTHELVTKDGYWHPTTLPTEIKLDNKIIGFKQIFTFYWGIAPKGEKSNFLIHEYKLNKEGQNFVACRVRDMEEFAREEEWDSEDEDWEN